MTQKLSPKLLHDLETYYHQIALLYAEGVGVEDITNTLQISDKRMYDMEEIIFAKNTIYTADNIFEGRATYKFNKYSLQSTFISQEIEDGIKKKL